MAMPVPVPGKRARPGSGLAVTYAALVFTPGVLAWFAVIGMATVGFAAQVTKYDYELFRPDVLGFAFAFAMAGMITGLVASATSGNRPWTIAFGAISAVLLGVSPAIVRWWIYRFTSPSAAWGQRLWDSAVGTISTGLIVGSLFGILLSGFVLVAAVVERRTSRWWFGLMVAASVAVLGSIGLPMAMSYVVESGRDVRRGELPPRLRRGDHGIRDRGGNRRDDGRCHRRDDRPMVRRGRMGPAIRHRPGVGTTPTIAV